MAKMIKCKKCGKVYYSKMPLCPACSTPRPSNPKKVVFIVLIILAVIVAISLISNNLNGNFEDASSVGTSGNSQSAPNSQTQESENPKKDKDAVIYSDDNIKVTFNKVADASDYGIGVTACYIYLKVENISSKTFTVMLTDAYVNDSAITIMSGLPMTLAPGKNSNQPFMFGYNNILTSADEVEKLEFKITLMDENYNTIETTKTITVDVK